MAVDLVGPFKSGKDLGVDQTAKYMMLATVPVPYEMDKKVTDSEEKPVEEAQEWGEGDGSGELEDLVGDRDEAEEGPVLEVEEDEPSEKVSEEDAKKVNAEWKKIAEELSEPYMVQNLTLGEPLQSRSVDEILSGMAKLLSKYKAMGVPVIRIHSDREKAMVSGRVRNWIAGQGVLQTMTGGDDGPGNGRIEAEVNQFKRRLRLSLSTTGWGETMWPQVARYEVEKRLRSQLEKMGIPQRPMPPIGASVVVKRKRWHRDSPLATPFRTMQLLCPSPMMTSGWLVRDGDQVVHARVALLPDHQADVAIKQWAETDPENPRRRLRGKQPVQVPDVVLPEGYPVRPPLEEGPSLHVLHAKAGGGSHGALKGQQCELSQSQDQVDQPHGVPELHEVTGEDLCVCQGCGVHQMKAYKVCKMCEEPLKVEASSEEDGVLWEEEPVSVEDLAREHDELRQVHWRWRMEMTNGLKHMPLGEDEGKLQGCWMKFLQLQLLQTEQDLCEQVDWLEGHEVRTALRLASMKDQGSGDVGQEDEVPVVLQTYTVPLATVKKELDLWKPSFKQELHQLFEETKALRRTTDAQLAKEVDMDTVDYAPSKLVPTVKAPLGRRKARICICGNLLQADQNGKNPENYAGGADSLTLRIALRQAALRSWSVATCDVRTAFLWAPRRKSSRTITTRPPKVVIQAGLATEDEVWIVDHALYGLASSPADWGMHRDDRLAEVKWTSPEGGERWLERTTEANVWRIGQKLPNSFTETETIGDLLTHVDDLLIMADSATGKEVLTQVEALWTVSTPEWVSEDSWVKFCGLELKWRGESLMVSQASYTKELLTRYDGILEKDVPLPRLDGELEPEHDASWQDVRLAQTLVGEVLWLSARARADISYATAYMGARTIKNPKHVVRVGRHLLGYLKSTATWCLEYGPKDDNVVELEVESDASFAPRGRDHRQATPKERARSFFYDDSEDGWEQVRGKWHLVEMCEPILGLEDFEDEELDENSLVITFLTKEAGNPEDCGFKVESDQLIRPLEVKDFEVRSSSGNGGGEADGGERQVPEQEVKHVEMDPAVQEAGIVLREPFPESVVVNGVVLTEATKLRELRAACSFFGVGQSGSRRQCYQRIVSKLKEVELKAAAEVVANAQREVAREPRVQPVIPVPEEDEQERHRLVHTPYAPWCEFCIAHRAKQDRHLRSGNSKISSTPIISLDFCYTKAGTTVESNPGGEVRAEAAGGYAGRAELPDNLAALFRPVAMMVSDHALIGEITFYAYGFTDAKVLAKKMMTTFTLLSEQLSSFHYDYGMPAVKSTIEMCGKLK
eukprot:g1026.t1